MPTVLSLLKWLWNSVTRRPRNLFITFLSIWLVFGVTYWIIATFDSNNFIIQSDIDVTGRASAFRRMTGSNAPDEALKPLIVGWDSEKHSTVRLANLGDEVFTTFLLGDTLGDLWGKYYQSKYLSLGATHFEWRVLAHNQAAVGVGTGKYLVEVRTYYVPDISSHQRMFQEQEWVQLEGIIDKGSFRFYSDVDPVNMSPILSEPQIKYLPAYLSAFSSLVANAKSFPDDAVIALSKAQSGSWTRPVSDYLYFSAVTITTLGFGDILPNSSLVRVLVGIEALLGMIVAGVFVSSFTGWKPPEAPKEG